MPNLRQKRIKEKSEKALKIFLQSLNKYDSNLNFSEDDFLDEARCERELKKGNYDEKVILGYILEMDKNSMDEIRRDLINRYSQLKEEPSVRKKSANLLRKVRNVSNNGFKNLTRKKQYDILCNWKSKIEVLFGTEEIYLSKRLDYLGNITPLRKDITRYVFLKLLDVFRENSINRLD